MALPPLTAMGIFAHVVDAGGFTAAAERVGRSKSAVSKAVARLEEALGARLLLRTTRRIELTDAGAAFYERCARKHGEAEQAEVEIGAIGKRPRGTLRVNAPIALGRRLVSPVVWGMLAEHPDVAIDLQLQDDFVDLVATKTDVAVRVGQLVDASLIRRRLGDVRAFLVASPGYLSRRGRPARPEDLETHTFLVYTLTARPDRLTLERDGERVHVHMRGPFATNNGDAILDAALAGRGLAMLPDFIADDAVADGRLVAILDDWTVRPEMSIYAVYAQGGPVSPALRIFIDTLVARAASGWGAR